MPFTVTVYRVGDTYHGARRSDFGRSNYEIVPAVAEVSPLQ